MSISRDTGSSTLSIGPKDGMHGCRWRSRSAGRSEQEEMALMRAPTTSTGIASIGIALLVATSLLALPWSTQAQSKPNIVFILMDNLGYGEVGAYGGGITRGAPTPRID